MIHDPLPQPSAPPPSGTNYSAEFGCFEGPEKLLEIWFSPSPFAAAMTASNNSSNDHSDSEMSDESTPATPNESQINLSLGYSNNLRTVDRALWDSMLATVKCTVLSVVSNAQLDAYLLSESSMFVFPHKIVLKTCGTTTLLKAVPYILELARTRCGFESVYRLFYSRKSFMFPDKQPGPHRSWEEEVAYLDNHFEHGASYVIGNTRAEEWYLYLTSPDMTQHHHIENLTNMQQLMKETDGLSWMGNEDKYNWSKMDTKMVVPKPPVHETFCASSVMGYRTHDETIEILMTSLNPDAMRAFYHDGNEPSGLIGGKRVDKDTGLDMLYPEANVDSFLFEPCGYSCNGLQDDGYYTIHVTPEPSCSYASFETTIPTQPVETPGKNGHGREEAIRKLIRQVIDIFQPGSFTVTYFASHAHEDQQSDNINKLVRSVDQFGGYKRKDKILHEFEGYDLIFGHYTKM
ncbi:adenosylmethionine decarboxylase [Mucor mucedo]|uniref:adenosylmethionine decarboxylase n=1 Tax=Mucor mucedo TaxID=29922 RepID=UPI00221E958F|nr:adenosylmethionine decarboxylase [Mucor mucedo]KAI7893631.1 adenosylmethionine decarboxylase [Mucor mucedo]